MPGKVLVLVGDQRVRGALLARTTGPTDAMSMSVDVTCHVVVYHRPNVWYVKTTRYRQTGRPLYGCNSCLLYTSDAADE